MGSPPASLWPTPPLCDYERGFAPQREQRPESDRPSADTETSMLVGLRRSLASHMLPDRVVGSDGRCRLASRRPAKPSPVPEPLPASSSDAVAVSSPAVDPAPGPSVPLPVDAPDPVPAPASSVPLPAPSVGEPALVVASDSASAQVLDPAPSVPVSPLSPDVVSSSSLGEKSPSSGSSSVEAAPVSAALQSVTDRSNLILSTVVQAARGLTDNEDLIHFPCVDRDRLPEWIADLEEARRSLTRFITRLREEVSDGTRTSALED